MYGKSTTPYETGKVSYVRTYQRQQSEIVLFMREAAPRPTWNERKEITLEGQWSVEQNRTFPIQPSLTKHTEHLTLLARPAPTVMK